MKKAVVVLLAALVSYVPLARIDDPVGLAETCGGGDVTVTFETAG